MTITINIDGNILFVTGEYCKEEPDNGLAEDFQIETIESENKDIYDILEWVSSQEGDYLREIGIKCLEQINKQ